MSNELEALEKLTNYKCSCMSEKIECKEIIETALKRLEQQDDVLKILKEVVEFKIALPYIKPCEDNISDIMSGVSINIQRCLENKERELLRQWILETCFPKELKALKIIKEHKLLNYVLKNEKCANMYHLSKEKIDLLKVVLL